jgi:Ca-activated chloride channel family protein
MTLDELNYYEVLGVEPDAANDEIEAAFQVRRSDPALLEGADFEYFCHAYEVLSDPARRKLYDALLAEVREPVAVEVQVSHEALPLVDEPQLVYLLAQLQPPDAGKRQVLPLNLCLVIDRSTSMRGDRLQRVKEALRLLLSELSSGDMLSVVTFSDRAEIVHSTGPVEDHGRSLDWIDGIEASGATELYHGLASGVRQLRKVPLNDYNSQLILLTDGRTYGDAADCLKLAEEASSSGITMHAFGIGSDWDEDFLDVLVSQSGGLVEYIDTPQKLVSALRQRLQQLGQTYARQVFLEANWPRGVEFFDGFRLIPYAQPLRAADGQIILGDIEGGMPLSFVLALLINPQPIATRIRIPLQFSAELPGKGVQSFAAQVQLTLAAAPPEVRPSADIIRAARLLTLYRLHERAWQEAESGRIDQAAQRMQRLSTRLLEAGEPHLAYEADLEARRLLQTGSLSAAGRKSLRYGTRALTRKAIQLEWDG